MKQLRQQQGFTMIELIMVIVILGVLSAFALPRFADLGESARMAALQGLAGSMRSAVGITRAQVFASGVDATAATGTTTLDGQSIDLVYGYPSAIGASPGILTAAGIEMPPGATLAADTNSFVSGDYTYLRDDTTLIVYPTSNSACRITYAQSTNATTPPSINTAAVISSNC